MLLNGPNVSLNDLYKGLRGPEHTYLSSRCFVLRVSRSGCEVLSFFPSHTLSQISSLGNGGLKPVIIC
jgi:hypothetical protein